MAEENITTECPSPNDDFKGITFWKHSGFTGDCTRNCSLRGTDLDRNFYNLKAEDIKNAYLSGDTIYVERVSDIDTELPRMQITLTDLIKDFVSIINGTSQQIGVTRSGSTATIGFTDDAVFAADNK